MKGRGKRVFEGYVSSQAILFASSEHFLLQYQLTPDPGSNGRPQYAQFTFAMGALQKPRATCADYQRPRAYKHAENNCAVDHERPVGGILP